MNKQRKILITITYNEMGIIIDTKAEEVVQPNLQPICNNLATDCISRQAVIDTDGLDEEIRCEMCRNPMHTNRGCDGNCGYDEKLYKKIIQILDKRIRPLPSAQPEQRWIPVTEKLPAPFEYCLWTTTDGRVVYHHCDGLFSNYTAWMPLPEPYRGEGGQA